MYFDTSFLIDLIRYPNDPTNPCCKACFDFYSWTVTKGILIWISPYVIQEAIWSILRNGIRKEMGSLGISEPRFKDLQKLHPTEFTSAYSRKLPKVIRFYSFIKALGIRVDFTSPLRSYGNYIPNKIVRYAMAIINNFELEVGDAFHIATARLGGVKWIVSNDKDFQDVPTIGVYGYRKK